MRLHHALANPMVIWWLLFALLVSMVTWPAGGWRGAVRWLVLAAVGLVLAFRYLA